MQILLLIAGLILLLVSPPLFAGAGTVGVICLGVFGLLTAVQVISFAVARSAVKQFERKHRL